MANQYWLKLVKDMLWVFERETKFTLRGINDNFKHIGLSFDPEFRSNFLNIIVDRVGGTYDEFLANLMAEQQHQQQLSLAAHTEHATVVPTGRKRKITDNDDNNSSSNESNATVVGKRARTNDAIDAAGDATTATAITDDDDADQNQNNFDNLITDDNSSEQTLQATEENGQRPIGLDEAFNRGYVVVIPMRTTNEPEAAGSESGSSTTNRQTPATSDGSVTIKQEPSIEIDAEETAEVAEPSPSPSPSPWLPSQTPLSLTPMTIRQNADLSTIDSSELTLDATDLTPIRPVTRLSSRERSMSACSTPANPTPAKVTSITASNGSIAVNQIQNTPNSSKPRTSSAKKQRRQSTPAQEPQRPFQCKQCAYTTSWKCSFVRHLLVHNDSSIDLEHLQCEKCAHLVDAQQNLQSPKRRAKANGPEKMPFACNSCAKKFAEKDLLDMHQMTVHRHQCAKCKKKFANGQQADAHSKRCK